MIKVIIIILFMFSYANAMELCVKVGHQYPEDHPRHEDGWKDGQIIDIREDGFLWGSADRKEHTIIRVKDDFWALRGSTDWQADTPSVREFRKLISGSDSKGKYSWEVEQARGYHKKVRKRDFFIDYIKLKKDGDISQSDYDKIKNKEKKQHIYINKKLDKIVKKEGKDIREKE